MIYTTWRAIRDVGVTINIFGGRDGGGRVWQREVSPAYTKAPRNALYRAAPIVQSRRRSGEGRRRGARKGPLFITGFNNVPKSKSRAAGQQMFCRRLLSRVTLRSTFWLAHIIYIYMYYNNNNNNIPARAGELFAGEGGAVYRRRVMRVTIYYTFLRDEEVF